MAQDLDDGEFWLPSQFLTDDDILMDFKSDLVGGGGGAGKNRDNTVAGFGFFGPYSSGHSSPVESVVSSTETESDEEYYIAGLTQKMVRSTLQDDLWKEDSASGYETQKSVATAGSPQSTLCGVLGGCGCKQGSSRGSPNCTSPPATTELNRSDSAWDLLYAAAGEVARMRIVEDTNNNSNTNNNGFYQNRGLLAPPPRKPSPVSVPPKNHNPNQNISYQQIQLAQFQQLKQQQMMKQQAIWTQSKAASGNYHHQQQSQTQQVVGQNRARNNSGRPLGLSPAAWPTLQQSQQQQQAPPPPQPGSGMRAVFLGHNNGSKRECAGTGVFLPRGVGSQTETRKKPGCATVLLPDRVVQALNLNLEAMDSHQTHIQPRFKANFTPDHDAALKYRNNVFMPQQKRNLRAPARISQDHRLPPEWTY